MLEKIINSIFGNKVLETNKADAAIQRSSPEKIRQSRVESICHIIEIKVKKLREESQKGPLIHLRYLALKGFFDDKAMMREFLFATRTHVINFEDFDRLEAIKDDQKEWNRRWNSIESWEKSIKTSINIFFDLIIEKSLEIKQRGSICEGIKYGLELLAVEELFEERDVVGKNIDKEDWKKSRYGTCGVACIDDVECRIQIDRILREKLGEKKDSYEYDKVPTLNIFLETINPIYEKKRQSILAKQEDPEENLDRFRPQKGYWVNIERLIPKFEEARNFTIIYRPKGQVIQHALKVFDIQGNIIFAQDLCTGKDKIDVRKHNIKDLLAHSDDLCVVSEDIELTKEELSAITLTTDYTPSAQKTVDINEGMGKNRAHFKMKIEAIEKNCSAFLSYSNELVSVMVLCNFENGAYQNCYQFDQLLHDYFQNKVEHSAIRSKFTDGSDNIIISASRGIKDRYFAFEEELSDEEKSNTKMIVDYL